MINNLAHYRVFSTFDLKSAYQQIPSKETDKHYTAFEANGNLYQFCKVSFGVTNGVAVFQRLMDKLVTDECLKDKNSLILITLLSLEELKMLM